LRKETQTFVHFAGIRALNAWLREATIALTLAIRAIRPIRSIRAILRHARREQRQRHRGLTMKKALRPSARVLDSFLVLWLLDLGSNQGPTD
jgi:heme exporter protein D